MNFPPEKIIDKAKITALTVRDAKSVVKKHSPPLALFAAIGHTAPETSREISEDIPTKESGFSKLKRRREKRSAIIKKLRREANTEIIIANFSLFFEFNKCFFIKKASE